MDKIKVGQKVKITGNSNGSVNKIGDIGTILEYNKAHDTYRVEVPGNKTYSNWTRSDELELVENTPKFKVGDTVRLLRSNESSSNQPAGLEGKIVSDKDRNNYYRFQAHNVDYVMYHQEDNLELIKEKSTNKMKYKVIKWYPGCPGKEGEVIETSNDYSTAEYKEFYEKVKVNSLEEAVKASGLKIGDYLDNQKVKIYSEQVASSKEKERHTLTNHGNLVCTNVKVLEFAMIQNVPCARIMYTSESDVWVAISDLKTVPKPEMNFSDAGFDYTETKDYVQIGCQKYTLEDTKAFILTMNRAELDVLSFRSGRLPVTKQQIMYVHNLLNK